MAQRTRNYARMGLWSYDRMALYRNSIIILGVRMFDFKNIWPLLAPKRQSLARNLQFQAIMLIHRNLRISES